MIERNAQQPQKKNATEGGKTNMRAARPATQMTGRPPPPTMRPSSLPFSIASPFVLLHAVLFSPFSHAMALASPSTTIVVSGACGKVGSRLLRQLLNTCSNDGSNQIVALVRDANKLKNMMKDTGNVDNGIAGLSIMQADYSNPDQLRDAFESIPAADECRLFLSCGNVPDQANLELNVLKEAIAYTRSSKSSLFTTKLSTATPIMDANDGEGASAYAKEHRVVEEYLRANCDGNYCVLRPNMFMQVLTAGSFLGINIPFVADDPEMDGSLIMKATHPMADCTISMIDCIDVASVAANILLSTKPAEEHGNKFYELTGPSAVSIRKDVANAISEELQRSVEIENIPLEAALESNGIPSAAAKGLQPFLDELGKYKEVTGQVEQLLNRPGRSIRDFVRDEKSAFESKS